MSSDLFTKNLERPLFERHAETFCGIDECSKSTKKLSRGECRRVKLRALSRCSCIEVEGMNNGIECQEAESEWD
jgi:hypothetical protein